MTTAVLTQVQRLVDQLTPLEQAKLVEYLTPRLVQALIQAPPVPSGEKGVLPQEWQALFALGDNLVRAEDAPSLTNMVLEMRR